jgi:putative membrane protein
VHNHNLSCDRYKKGLLLAFTFFFIGSCLNPPYQEFLLMQHAPTILAVAFLIYMSERFDVSRASFTSIVLFLALHTLGARYLYSYTPYDDWSEYLLGYRLSAVFGFTRNHYDRAVHFSFGLLLAVPIQDFERRYLKLSIMVSSVLAVECILAASAAYELLEWLVAVVFTPRWAEQFLGMQGDVFDGQKDMALATGGAALSVACSRIWSKLTTVRLEAPLQIQSRSEFR